MQVPNDAQALTKPPPWHGWVTADLFLSELSSGTFVVAAVGQLSVGDSLKRLTQIGFLLALGAIVLDLICSVADLGDPRRFFHMLRRLKLRSPMSLGVWGNSIYAMFAFACAAMATARIGSLEKIQLIVATVGIAPALFVGLYKGVLFSTSAQPVWRGRIRVTSGGGCLRELLPDRTQRYRCDGAILISQQRLEQHRAGLRVICAVDQPRDPRLNNRARAHSARFDRHV